MEGDLAGTHGACLLAGRVVEVGLDGRGRAAEPARDLDDRELLGVAVVAGERGGAAALGYAVEHERHAVGHTDPGYGPRRRKHRPASRRDVARARCVCRPSASAEACDRSADRQERRWRGRWQRESRRSRFFSGVGAAAPRMLDVARGRGRHRWPRGGT